MYNETKFKKLFQSLLQAKKAKSASVYYFNPERNEVFTGLLKAWVRILSVKYDAVFLSPGDIGNDTQEDMVVIKIDNFDEKFLQIFTDPANTPLVIFDHLSEFIIMNDKDLKQLIFEIYTDTLGNTDKSTLIYSEAMKDIAKYEYRDNTLKVCGVVNKLDSEKLPFTLKASGKYPNYKNEVFCDFMNLYGVEGKYIEQNEYTLNVPPVLLNKIEKLMNGDMMDYNFNPYVKSEEDIKYGFAIYSLVAKESKRIFKKYEYIDFYALLA